MAAALDQQLHGDGQSGRDHPHLQRAVLRDAAPDCSLPGGTFSITVHRQEQCRNRPGVRPWSVTLPKLNPFVSIASSANPSTQGQPVTLTSTSRASRRPPAPSHSLTAARPSQAAPRGGERRAGAVRAECRHAGWSALDRGAVQRRRHLESGDVVDSRANREFGHHCSCRPSAAQRSRLERPGDDPLHPWSGWRPAHHLVSPSPPVAARARLDRAADHSHGPHQQYFVHLHGDGDQQRGHFGAVKPDECRGAAGATWVTPPPVTAVFISDYGAGAIWRVFPDGTGRCRS
jgi:hypothetical protein